MTASAEPVDAVHALRDRGVDQPEQLLEHATPMQILAACHRWDQRQGVRPGLLVKWIRAGQFEDEPSPPAQGRAAVLRARFDEYASRFPVDATVEPHRSLTARQWPGDELDCAGSMVVTEAIYPLLALECDRCGFEAAIPVRHLHVLDGRATR